MGYLPAMEYQEILGELRQVQNQDLQEGLEVLVKQLEGDPLAVLMEVVDPLVHLLDRKMETQLGLVHQHQEVLLHHQVPRQALDQGRKKQMFATKK